MKLCWSLLAVAAMGCSNKPSTSASAPSSASTTALPSTASDKVPSPLSESEAMVLDVADVTSQQDRFVGEEVEVRGLVASVCRQEGCFIDIVPASGAGEGILVSGRHGPGNFPLDCVGKVATVRGTFYRKIYPRSRMEHWHHHGWRPAEQAIPAFAMILRIEADSVAFSDAPARVAVNQPAVRSYESRIVDLALAEFEAAGMGTGRKCLEPGQTMPEHSTGRYHELILAIEGEVKVTMASGVERLAAGQACYVPPETRHSVTNGGTRRACYVFVYSVPEGGQAATEASDASSSHKQ